MKKLSIIIVNYNSGEELIVCIQSLRRYISNISYEIIVIDNNSTDNSRKLLKESTMDINKIFLENNTGYSIANNYGMEQCKGEYILLLNPDTYIKNNSIKEMIDFLDSKPAVGVLGPLLIDPDGNIQLPSSNFPDLKQQILYMLSCKFLLNRIARSSEQRVALKLKIPFEVDWVSGACFMLKRIIYETIGGLDESFFLYAEDVDWCIRIKDSGWKIFCHPSIEVVHIGGVSSKKNIYLLLTSRYKSNLYFAKKHFSSSQLFILRLIVVSGLFFRLILTPVIKIMKPNESRLRMTAYYNSILLWLGFESNNINGSIY